MCERLQTVPVLAAVDGDDVLGGVEQLFAVVSPRQGGGDGVGVELCSEAQALALFNISLYWTRVS